MWLKWLPWRFIVKHVAQSFGFLDPFLLFSHMDRFAQPSEVALPLEALRSGAVLHARGLINSIGIQQNLDWVWPYWVEKQFHPGSDSFIPRAFSITHINLTHRNWTAVGLPDFNELPLVDPRGLFTPFFDGWSVDAWLVTESGKVLLPSRLPEVKQQLLFEEEQPNNKQKNLIIRTQAEQHGLKLESQVKVVAGNETVSALVDYRARLPEPGWLVIAIRPFNPEGISFIQELELLQHERGFLINKKQKLLYDCVPDKFVFSYYRKGDIFHRLFGPLPDSNKRKEKCYVGMATAAGLYKITPQTEQTASIRVPLKKLPKKGKRSLFSFSRTPADMDWQSTLKSAAQLKLPNKHFEFLYQAALRTIILHSPQGEVFPGPYTYKKFWFRDAVYIVYAIMCANLFTRAKEVIDKFPTRQTSFGYFYSQKGEWDSNGQVLWVMDRYCRLSGEQPDRQWLSAIHNGADWIVKKRLPNYKRYLHSGLMPAGFSAEHFGTNDYYYWDNFWSVAGLQGAAAMFRQLDKKHKADEYSEEAESLARAIDASLKKVAEQLHRPAMPVSPYRRLDSACVGSLAAGYPLQLWPATDERLLDTADYLYTHCLYDNCLFHVISHSGINAYLTLHLAQVFLRAGDKRFYLLMQALADFASPTGQWPEAIHPQTRGGCMGDGQHVWAAAEWILMLRNCFVYEEETDVRLVLGAGVPGDWLNAQPEQAEEMFFGPLPTAYGRITVRIKPEQEYITVSWEGHWHKRPPEIVIRFPDYPAYTVPKGKTSCKIKREAVAQITTEN